MVALGLFRQPWRGKSGHRRTGCFLTGRDSLRRIMDSATENKPPSGKGETVV